MKKTIKWDGRERTAERILKFVPAGLASWWGGARKPKRVAYELFIRSKPSGHERKVPIGSRVGLRNGVPVICRKMPTGAKS